MPNTLKVDAPEGMPWIDWEREFDAPVPAVFAAHTDPQLYVQWIGPAIYTNTIEQFDVRPGGGYRFRSVSDDFTAVFHGVFHQVKQDELIIQTFEFDGVPDAPSLETLRFESLSEGRCKISGRTVGFTVEGRDMMLQSGMEDGMAEGFDRLELMIGAS